MKTLLLLALANIIAAGQIELTENARGGVSFEGGSVVIQAYGREWKPFTVVPDWKTDAGAGVPFTLETGGTAYFRGKSVWRQDSGSGRVHAEIRLECLRDCAMNCLAPAVRVEYADGEEYKAKSSKAESYSCALKTGKVLDVSFSGQVSCRPTDGRRWGNYWAVRFGPYQNPAEYRKGETLSFSFDLSSPSGLKLLRFEPCEIVRSGDWIPVVNHKDIVPGSALDFSSQGLLDAPAGKYGWLRASGGDFVFEGRPSEPVRFYGVNLCFSANYPSHELADRLVERLSRIGYNSIRIHHNDRDWKEGDNRDRLDYLLAAAYKKGIYATCDLYISRDVTWASLGVNRPGKLEKNLYKSLVACWEPAFRDWCAFAEEYLQHVNPYTGRALKDEPGMPLISLINEGKLGMHYAEKSDDARLLDAWNRFGGEGSLPKLGTQAFNAFQAHLDSLAFARCSAFVRSLGAKAMLTNDNNGSSHGEGEGCTPMYDYVDNHFYVGHPKFLGGSWRLPAEIAADNPVSAGGPGLLRKGYATAASKPYTITEWNFAAPGRFRSMGGLLTGALCSCQGWDGLWRFAYAHKEEGLVEGKSVPGWFNVSDDPLMQAGDRAAICLFLRRDAAEGGNAVSMDVKSGTFSVVTPLTCGFFCPGGSASAGFMEAEVEGAPATLWISSLDGRPLEESSRMLLTHLTDVQQEGSVYADPSRSILRKWGNGSLVQRGAAKISIPVKGKCEVYELSTSGRRVRKLDCSRSKGRLSFTVCSAGPSGGRIYYEIVRD